MKSREERNKLIESNMGLVYKAVNLFGTKYLDMKHPCISIEDLEQSATLAMINAADKYDPERGAAFSTYAMKAMKNELFIQYQQMMTPAQCMSFSYDMDDEYEEISEAEKMTIFLGNDEFNVMELRMSIDAITKELEKGQNKTHLLRGIEILFKREEGYTIKEAGEKLGLTFKQAKSDHEIALRYFRKKRLAMNMK